MRRQQLGAGVSRQLSSSCGRDGGVGHRHGDWRLSALPPRGASGADASGSDRKRVPAALIPAKIHRRGLRRTPRRLALRHGVPIFLVIAPNSPATRFGEPRDVARPADGHCHRIRRTLLSKNADFLTCQLLPTYHC